jgi:sporulation protein YlmC with PRC-barrel domain
MRKIVSALAVLLVLSFGLFEAGSYAETIGTEGWHIYELKPLLTYGVKNPQGQYLGRMQDFVIDSNGRVIFAVITKPGMLGIRGEPVAVPFQALSFGSGKNELVLDMSREKFASAPRYDRKTDLENSAEAANIYRYFGVQPYWTE